MPKVAEGEILKILDIRSKRENTTETYSQSRYTEAGLIKELEKRGIGGPSTYADVMKTIEDRGSCDKKKKARH